MSSPGEGSATKRRSWFGVAGGAIALMLFALVGLWWRSPEGMSRVERLPGIGRLLAPVPSSDPARFTVALAESAGDSDGQLRKQLVEIVRKTQEAERSIDVLSIPRTIASVGDGTDEARQ